MLLFMFMAARRRFLEWARLPALPRMPALAAGEVRARVLHARHFACLASNWGKSCSLITALTLVSLRAADRRSHAAISGGKLMLSRSTGFVFVVRVFMLRPINNNCYRVSTPN